MQLLITFIAVIIMNTLGTLKTVFIVRKKHTELHVVMFIDSILYVMVMSKVINGEGIKWALIYAVGRYIGTIIANNIEERMALGSIYYNIFFSDIDKARLVRDELGDRGYSVNITNLEGYKDRVRYKLEIVLARKESENMYEILSKHGVEEPTLIASDIDGVEGKIKIYSRD